MVAVPTTSFSLINGTTTTPDPSPVVAVAVFAPSTVKRPRSVVNVTVMPSAAGVPAAVIKVAEMRVELVPFAIRELAPDLRMMPATSVMGVGGGAMEMSSMARLWTICWDVAMIVAVPATPVSLMNGTITVPLLVVEVRDLTPLVLKNPLSVVKATAVPSAGGAPAEVIKVAVTVVELTPSASSSVCPAARVIPTTGLVVGGVGGVVGGGVVGGSELGGGVSLGSPPPPPPPAF